MKSLPNGKDEGGGYGGKNGGKPTRDGSSKYGN